MRRRRALEAARDPVALALVALTVAGLLLRLPALGQGLDGDEFFTYTQTVDRPFNDVLGADQENNPPLFYVLAWAAAKLGDPTVWIRLPSLVLGTASIPVVYALGVRTAGRAPGLVGAAVIALSPFSAFYGIEARSYAALVFFSALATLSLLTALDTGRRRWWALYALSSAGVLYTHYLGVFVLLAQAAWSLWAHRPRLRPLLLANGAVALGALPLLPSVFGMRGALLPEGPLTANLLARETLRLFYGHPQVPWDELPGRFAVLVLAATGVGALAFVAADALGGRRSGRSSPSPRMVLLALLAVATPVGFLLYSLAGPSIVLGRYLLPSLPALALLTGVLLTSLPRVLSLGAATVLCAVLAAGAVGALDSEYQRPDYKSAARFVEGQARAGDVIVDADSRLTLGQAFLGGGLARSGETYLTINLKGRPGLRRVSSLSAAVGATARRDHVFLVGREALLESTQGLPLRPLEAKRFPGIRTLAVRIYAREGEPEAAAGGPMKRRASTVRACLRRQGLSPARADGTAGAVVFEVSLTSGARGLVLLFASPALAERSLEGLRALVGKGGGEAERRGSAVIGYFRTPRAPDARLIARCLPA